MKRIYIFFYKVSCLNKEVYINSKKTNLLKSLKSFKINNMKIKETKVLQEQRLKEISTDKGVDYESLKSLLESVRTKRLLKRNNYHQQKINDIIEKVIK